MIAFQEGSREGRIPKEQKETLEGDGYVHCLDHGGGFMGVASCIL